MLLPVINIDSELCFVYEVQVLLFVAVREQWNSEAAEWEREGMCKQAQGLYEKTVSTKRTDEYGKVQDGCD